MGNNGLKQRTEEVPLDHTSVATLRAVTDATQHLISHGTTHWSDVEALLDKFAAIDIATRTNFPGSRIVSEIVEISSTALKRDHHFTSENTLFASSVCPDEINHDHDNLTAMFAREWGECFHLGGLAGIPFTGKTGFTAYSHHVPDSGNLFILFAPHIGISPEGELGKYAREGQDREHYGAACGAAIGAYQHLVQGGETPDFTQLGQHPFDYQQQWIISKVKEHMEAIGQADNAMAGLSREMYAIVEDYINHIVRTDFYPPDTPADKQGSVVLLGGIHINTPCPMQDMFLPLTFQLRKHGEETIDLMHHFRDDSTIKPINTKVLRKSIHMLTHKDRAESN